MQRHFSNRGEALSEVAAAKIRAHRISKPDSSQRRTRFTPERWPTRVAPSFLESEKRKPKEKREAEDGSARVLSQIAIEKFP